MRLAFWLALIVGLAATGAESVAQSGALEAELRGEDPSYLLRTARLQGDPRRGARLFHRSALGCVSCHSVAGHGGRVGPDLALPRAGRAPEEILESILNPSKVITPGFEMLSLALSDGRAVSGLLVEERPDRLILRDPARSDALVEVLKATIDERRASPISAMPEGLVNTLADRQEFLDLARYVLEITEAGAARARLLEPAQADLAPLLPTYENDLDHARLIRMFGPETFERGKQTYERVCANCHGTPDRPGSLPSSLRFWADRFRNGSEPFRIYQTLTHGFEQMPAQTWMTPRAKYEVIHYIREAYLRPSNASQVTAIDDAYLASLPSGTSLGPDTPSPTPWLEMDYGPAFGGTIEVGETGANIAYKGLAIRLAPRPGGVARGSSWVLYELDTMRVAGWWTGSGFIDWQSIQLDGRHEVHPRAVGDVIISNPNLPGWKYPRDPSVDDCRIKGRDGVAYGPLPRDWVRFHGRYQHGAETVLAYSVGDTRILERPDLRHDPARPEIPILTRTFEVAPRSVELIVRLGDSTLSHALENTPGATIEVNNGVASLHLAPATTTLRVTTLSSRIPQEALSVFAREAPRGAPLDLLMHGGPPPWPETLTVAARALTTSGPFRVDELTLPSRNPWNAIIRPTGFDFLDAGTKAAVCTWDGDVWLVDLARQDKGELTWRRVASGLFQPLGLLVRDGQILVSCRDQIVALHDLDGDSSIDFYESINSDHQVTEHFHEFAMGLQADKAGNLYYTKAARHALPPLVPQHGTLLRVSADGAHTEILATGFRAPNGVCLNADGSYFVTDQEGHWIPKNRLNLVRPGQFFGNVWGYTEPPATAETPVVPPVCWITNAFDRSPAEPLWVTSDAWADLNGALLSLSYGYGRVFRVLMEELDGASQGGMVALPIPALPTGLVRGRFHPGDRQLYVCGMFAWAGNQTLPGGFYRITRTSEPLNMPTSWHALTGRISLEFSDPLDEVTATDPGRWSMRAWDLNRSANYGSPHVNEHELRIRGVALSEDARTVTIDVPDLAPAQGVEIRYTIMSARQTPVEGVIHGTIHRLP